MRSWWMRRAEDIGKTVFQIGRPKHASLDMVEAHVNDLLLDPWGFSEGVSFELSRDIGKLLKRLEGEGYLVVLRQDSACYHCGDSWPRKEGQPHVTLCKKCVEEQLAKAPPEDQLDEYCKRQEEYFKKGIHLV